MESVDSLWFTVCSLQLWKRSFFEPNNRFTIKLLLRRTLLLWGSIAAFTEA